MKQQMLKVHSVNDYARYIGAPELHPLVSVIHYDELEHCRHSLNNYDVYGIFIADEFLENLTYGLLRYDLHQHAIMCVSPGQIGGKSDMGEDIQTKGWALLFDPALLHGTELGKRMSQYTLVCRQASIAFSFSASSATRKMKSGNGRRVFDYPDESRPCLVLSQVIVPRVSQSRVFFYLFSPLNSKPAFSTAF